MRTFVSIAAVALLLAAGPVLAGPDEAPAVKTESATIPAGAPTVSLKDTGGKLILEINGDWAALPDPARRMVLDKLKERLPESELKRALKDLVAGKHVIELTPERREISKNEAGSEIEEIEIEIEQCGPMIGDPVIEDESCGAGSGGCGCGKAGGDAADGDEVDEKAIQKAIEESLLRLKEMKALQGSIRAKVVELSTEKDPDGRIVITGGDSGDVQILRTDKDGRFHVEGLSRAGRLLLRAEGDTEAEVRIFGRDGKEIEVEGPIRGKVSGPDGHHGRHHAIEPGRDRVVILRSAPGGETPKEVRIEERRIAPPNQAKVMVLGAGGLAGRDGQSALIRALEGLRQEIQGLRAEIRGMHGDAHGPRAPMIRMAPGAQPKAPRVMTPGKTLYVTPKVPTFGVTPATGQMEAELKKLYAQVAEQKAMIHVLMKRLEILEQKLSK